MQSLRFYQLPMVVKIAVGVVFNNAWWSIEEFGIDRVGLWKLARVLPGQKSKRISYMEA